MLSSRAKTQGQRPATLMPVTSGYMYRAHNLSEYYSKIGVASDNADTTPSHRQLTIQDFSLTQQVGMMMSCVWDFCTSGLILALRCCNQFCEFPVTHLIQ